MKITILAHRGIQALGRLFGGATSRPRGRPAAPVIRLPRVAVPPATQGPVVRWRLNPVSGRLECRWTVVGGQPADDASSFERFGAILSGRRRGPAWD